MRDKIRASIDAYARDGVPTGGFLRSVLEHLDVFEVFARADEENTRDMREILRYVYNEIPSDCHGSREKVDAWLGHFARAREAEAEVAANVAEADAGGVTPDERASLGVEGK